LGALLFMDFNRIRKLFPECAEMANQDIVCHGPLKKALDEGIRRYNQRFPGSSTRIARTLLLDTPPNIDAGEITDKGHINQRGVLALREEAVQRLYNAGAPDADCIVFETAASI